MEGVDKTKALKTVQLIICFSCSNKQRQAEIVRVHRIKGRRVENHLEKQRPGHEGSCAPWEESARKV